MNKRTVVISLGSNLGNRLKNLGAAVNALRLCGFDIKDMSRVWETLPWGETNQPRFLNMCLTAKTDMSCDDMLVTIKKIEKELGRTETKHWGPREIDIDILLAGDEIYESEGLTIPHQLMQERAFVL
ncbi:MAG: 2-amino-4-hydroxy-6-hydroxymethyldihydropteridine diphosphokinase, partial [Synergistaceae bacterium]|nr:2-amino-4-hydroxy-6-hydroxymethyldihydropteridine diphosphokinase [Synergistaceae bacterium]